VSAGVRVSVPMEGARSGCEVFDDRGPVLSVETPAGSLMLEAPAVVTDGDVRAAWALIDSMRVYVLAVERQRDRESVAGRAAPARTAPGPVAGVLVRVRS
jgi:hypothetical protein